MNFCCGALVEPDVGKLRLSSMDHVKPEQNTPCNNKLSRSPPPIVYFCIVVESCGHDSLRDPNTRNIQIRKKKLIQFFGVYTCRALTQAAHQDEDFAKLSDEEEQEVGRRRILITISMKQKQQSSDTLLLS